MHAHSYVMHNILAQASVSGKPFNFVIRAIIESDFGVITTDVNGR
jgi:hypothetical protein